MLILHLLAGLVLGFGAALWSWSEGYSLWAMLGHYVVGGNLGMVASAAVVLMHSRAPIQSEPSGRSQAA